MSNIYDKVLKETFKELFDSLSKIILKLDVKLIEVLYPELQITLGREPDFIYKVRDKEGNEFILHIELQSQNDRNMLERMILYYALLWNIYRLPVMQFVIYIGDKRMNMNNSLSHFNVFYMYNLLDMKEIPCDEFLSQDIGEAVVLSVLCDMKGRNREEFIKMMLKRLQEIDKESKLLFEKHVKQVSVLSRLRGLEEIFKKEVESMPVTIDISKDVFYIEGKKEGIREGKKEGIREGIREGLLEGIHDVLEIKFGSEGLRLMERIKVVRDVERLESIREKIKKAKSLDEIGI
jgi:predicted transposase YdaD